MFAKRNQEPVPELETTIWTCSNDDCTCWMRENLTFEEEPTCPMCSSSMTKGTRMLPPLTWNVFR
ncbi:cold-shock protein [Brevibacillus composti]|uniref:Cold-shock protein n=1 Tax=Brevibacillus composti TaxID=2796470 RepID=A0A7T5JM33_9BACL|nr:cold-shock protein [Brevibacillus composti]QQE72616.1 cold-shock protein [Brevibacillus composti]QUO39693.1 cold-shock protein [Brevibacillus composti]